MKLYSFIGWGFKRRPTLLVLVLLLIISSVTHAKQLNDWLYWNSYSEWEVYSIQDTYGAHYAGSSLSFLSTGFDVHYGALSAQLYGEYKEDITESVELERAQLAWAPKRWLTLSVGQNYLPFAYIDTLSVSYAPTASLGLTLRENLALSMHSDIFYLSAYTYKTNLKYWDIELEEGATNKVLDHYGADFTISFPGEVLTVGASYMSNLGDSDLFADVFPEAEYIAENVPVSAVYASLFWKRLGVILEVIEANKAFTEYYCEVMTEVDGETVTEPVSICPYDFEGYPGSLRPRATNAEIAIYASPDSWVLMGYRTTREAEFTGLAAEDYVLSYTNAFYKKHIYIGFELNLSKSYSNEDTNFERLSTKGFAFKLKLNY